jgi:hypothetical protein
MFVATSGSKRVPKSTTSYSPECVEGEFSEVRLYGVLRSSRAVTGSMRVRGGAGTPSAVLVDAEGTIASEVAVGAQAVLQMAGASRTGS